MRSRVPHSSGSRAISSYAFPSLPGLRPPDPRSRPPTTAQYLVILTYWPPFKPFILTGNIHSLILQPDPASRYAASSWRGYRRNPASRFDVTRNNVVQWPSIIIPPFLSLDPGNLLRVDKDTFRGPFFGNQIVSSALVLHARPFHKSTKTYCVA